MNLTERLQQFYVGYYGRPADPGGMSYWLEQANGAYLNQDSRLAAAFGSVDQAEFRSMYSLTPTPEAFITRIYLNLFGREPEQQGLQFFSDVLRKYVATPGLSVDEARGILIARVIDGAVGEDRALLSNKITLAKSFTDEFRAKNVSISNAQDLDLMRGLFTGGGSGRDDWLVEQRLRLPEVVGRLQANDSVHDYMVGLVSLEQGVTPNPNASARISYSGSYLIESSLNNGQVTGSILLSLANGSFSGVVGSSKGTVGGVPAGLTAKLVKTSENTLTLTFLGAADDHEFAASLASITVTLSDADFNGLRASNVEGARKSNLGIGFVDAAIHVSDGLLKASGQLALPVSVNLETDTLLIGPDPGRPVLGSVDQATSADFSSVTGASKTNVTFVGDAAPNVFKASPLGDTIRGKLGNDTLQGGAGADRFVFEATAKDNGTDRIKDFSVAADILDFSAYLNKVGTKNLKPQITGATQLKWESGDVLVWQGINANLPETVRGLFARTASDTSSPFAFAKSDGKIVLITTGLTGDSFVWFIKKEAGATATFDAAKNPIELSDITLVGVLEGVSNAVFVPFAAGNFG